MRFLHRKEYTVSGKLSLSGSSACAGIVVGIFAAHAGQVAVNVGRAFAGQNVISADIGHHFRRIYPFFKNFDIPVDELAPATLYFDPFDISHNYLLHEKSAYLFRISAIVAQKRLILQCRLSLIRATIITRF